MCKHLFALLLFSSACTATAQRGQIGMPMGQLQATLGSPLHVERVEGNKPWFFRGQDEIWFYPGGNPGMSFSYGITEGRVSSTHAILSLLSQQEAERWASAYAAALQQKGWRPAEDGADRRHLTSTTADFYVEIVPVQNGYGVVLSHTLRTETSSAAPPPEAFLGFHLEQTTALAQAPVIPPAQVANTPATPTAARRSTPATAQVRSASNERDAHGQRVPEPGQPAGQRAAPPSPIVSPSSTLAPRSSREAKKPGSYTWVVASLPTSEDAERLAARYRADGYPSRVVSGHHRNQVVYRVGIGIFAGLDELKAARDSLPEGVPDAWALRIEEAQSLQGGE